MNKSTYKEIYDDFYSWNPELGSKVIDYEPWGSTSIVIWLNNGMIYKVKRYEHDKFVLQTLSKEDVDRKFGLNK